MNGDDPKEESGMFLPAMADADDGSEPGEPSSGAEGLIGVGEDFSSGAKKSRISNGTLIILLVVVAAGGALYLMRQFGLGSKLNLVDVKIDYPIDGNNSAEESKNQKVLDELRHSALAVQVPLDKVKKNPFEMTIEDQQPAPTTRQAKPIDRAAQERQRRADLIQSTLSSLKVNSVLGGSVPIARVSGETVRIGDTIKGLFVVRSIHGRTVELMVDGRTYSLTMGQ